MARVAFYTFGILQEPHDHPQIKDFNDRASLILDETPAMNGFIDSVFQNYPTYAKGRNDDADLIWDLDYGRWGKFAAPRFYQGSAHRVLSTLAQTLSLWVDLESVYTFAYSGLHLEAFRRRKEWFVRGEWPTYVIWWLADDAIPTWQDACRRLEYLSDHGSSPHAFDFKHAIGPTGEATQVDRSRIPLASDSAENRH